MPSFERGYYQFTALIPLRQDGDDPEIWRWHPMPRSASHSLRELLDSLRTVDVPLTAREAQSDGAPARSVPFSRNARTHFARLVVVDDLAYNGRQQPDTAIGMLRDVLAGLGWTALQFAERDQVDHLPQPYLLVLLDFDAADGQRDSVERYLHELWSTTEQEWTLILRHCRGFTRDPLQREASFVALLVEHELESTFSFSTYGWAAAKVSRQSMKPAPPPERQGRRPAGLPGLLWIAIVVVIALGVLVVHHPMAALAWMALGLGLATPLLWQVLLRLGNRPGPAEPGTDLRSVLKALYLQGAFLEMAETWQNRDASGPASLRHHFRDFLQVVQPGDLEAPSLRPGQIHSIRGRTPS
jgi:hypothetical protein